MCYPAVLLVTCATLTMQVVDIFAPQTSKLAPVLGQSPDRARCMQSATGGTKTRISRTAASRVDSDAAHLRSGLHIFVPAKVGCVFWRADFDCCYPPGRH